MAFVALPALPLRATAPASSSCIRPTMSVSRRGMLRVAGLAALAVAAPVLASEPITLKKLEGDLKQDVEALDYDTELLDIGPDSREKNPVDIPKPKKQNATIAAQEKREAEEEAEYAAMVAKEKAEAAKIREAFRKKLPDYK